jgi:hypothetical protein
VVFSVMIGIVLGVAAILYIGLPIRRGIALRQEQTLRRAAQCEKDAALQLLGELRHDRQTGKLQDEDYEELRSAAEAQAIAAMKTLDRLDRPGGEDPLEEMIALERMRLEGRRQR